MDQRCIIGSNDLNTVSTVVVARETSVFMESPEVVALNGLFYVKIVHTVVLN